MHDPRDVAVYLGLDVGKGEHHAKEIFTVLEEQTVIVAGTDAATAILPGLATS